MGFGIPGISLHELTITCCNPLASYLETLFHQKRIAHRIENTTLKRVFINPPPLNILKNYPFLTPDGARAERKSEKK